MINEFDELGDKLIGYLYCIAIQSVTPGDGLMLYVEGPEGGMKFTGLEFADIYKTGETLDAGLDALMDCNLRLYTTTNEDEEGFTNWMDETMNKYGYEDYEMADILEVWRTEEGNFNFIWM